MESDPDEWPGQCPGSAGSGALRWSRRDRDGWVVISAAGEVDWATAPILRRALAGPLTRPSPRVILDLTEVTFFDSSGLSVLILAHQKISKRGGRLVVVGVRPAIRKVLRMTDTDRFLSVHDTVGDALAQARPQIWPAAAGRTCLGVAYGIDDWLWPGGADTDQIGLN